MTIINQFLYKVTKSIWAKVIMKICVAAKYLGLMVRRYLCFRVFFGRSIKGKMACRIFVNVYLKPFYLRQGKGKEVRYFE